MDDATSSHDTTQQPTVSSGATVITGTTVSSAPVESGASVSSGATANPAQAPIFAGSVETSTPAATSATTAPRVPSATGSGATAATDASPGLAVSDSDDGLENRFPIISSTDNYTPMTKEQLEAQAAEQRKQEALYTAALTDPNPGSDPAYADQGKYNPTTGAAQQSGLIWAFFYDPATKVLIAPCICYKQPGETAPVNSTFVVPPAPLSGSVSVFDPTIGTIGRWVRMEDHRGQVVYNKKTHERSLWTQPGKISSDYTTHPPMGPYMVFDDAKDEWVTDEGQARAALAKKAFDRYTGQILPDEQLMKMDNITPGPQYKQYVSAVMAIMAGTDTTSTTIPPVPRDVTL